MADAYKDFADLVGLRERLRQEELARQQAETERVLREARERHEANLFRNSIGQVAPLANQGKVSHPVARPLPLARQHIADEMAALEQSLADDFNVDTLLDTDDELSFSRNGISRETVRKLRRGHWVTQGQLDLHGLRTDEAREALALFLRHAIRRGQRCVRVIHGKGLGSVNKEPVLKRKVRNWLQQKQEVLAFCQARAIDGGAGALMVLLQA